MRSLLLVVALVACSSSTKPKPPALDIEQLITSDTIGVFRQPGDQMFVLRYTDQLIVGLAGGTAPPCWTELTKKVKAGYQLSLAAEGGAYFVVEGDLPPAEVIACVKLATKDDIVGKQEGELYSFTSPAGTVYAAWRGRHVVIGTRAQVEAALKPPSPDTVATWHALIESEANAPTYMVRIDHSFDDIVGSGSRSYAFVIDKMEKEPRPLFVGRFVIRYMTPSDAAAGEKFIREWSGKGQFPRRIEDPAVMRQFDSIAAGVAKTKITRISTVLEIRFDSDQFGGVEAMAAALQSLAPKPAPK